MWDIPVLEIKPMSPALAGRVLTTGPQGIVPTFLFKDALFKTYCGLTHVEPWVMAL